MLWRVDNCFQQKPKTSFVSDRRLKTVNLIVKNTQGAEALVKQYETKLGEEDAVPPDPEAIRSLQNTLKVMKSYLHTP